MRNIANQGWSVSEELLALWFFLGGIIILVTVKIPAATFIAAIYLAAVFIASLLSTWNGRKVDFSLFWNHPVTFALTCWSLLTLVISALVFAIVYNL